MVTFCFRISFKLRKCCYWWWNWRWQPWSRWFRCPLPRTLPSLTQRPTFRDHNQAQALFALSSGIGNIFRSIVCSLFVPCSTHTTLCNIVWELYWSCFCWKGLLKGLEWSVVIPPRSLYSWWFRSGRSGCFWGLLPSSTLFFPCLPCRRGANFLRKTARDVLSSCQTHIAQRLFLLPSCAFVLEVTVAIRPQQAIILNSFPY